jgi:hypothetical protein
MKNSKYSVVNPFPSPWKVLIIIFAVGLAVIALGIVFMVISQKNIQNYVQIDATINEIVPFDPIVNDSQAYVDYVFNGTSYTHILLDSYSSSWVKGQTIQIFVNPADPSKPISQLSSTIGPYLVMGFGGVLTLLSLVASGYNLWNAQVFSPRHDGGNHVEAKLREVKPLGRGRYKLSFEVSGQLYWSRNLKGDYPFLQTLLSKQAVETPAYLDQAGHFVPDYKAFNASLVTLRNEAGLAATPDYKGLDPNDTGAHHF